MNDRIPAVAAARRRHPDAFLPPEPALDELLQGFARIAAQATGHPFAFVCLHQSGELAIRAAAGLAGSEPMPRVWPRELALCDHAPDGPHGVFEVHDLRADPRFARHPWVEGAPGIASYAGQALVLPDGEAIGALCVAHTHPTRLDGGAKDLLASVAQQVVAVLLLHEQRRELEQEKRIQDAVDWTDLAPCGMYALDALGRVLQANAAWVRMLDAPSEQALLGDGWMDYVHPEDLEQVQQARRAGLVDERAYTYGFRTRPDRRGASRWIRTRVSPVREGLEPVAFVGAAVDETHVREV